MSAFVLEASEGLRHLAGIREGDRIKRRIERAARAAGLPYWRAYDLWYGKAKRIDPDELEAIRRARLARAQERENELASVAADFEALAERVARLAAGSDRALADRARALAVRTRNLAEGE